MRSRTVYIGSSNIAAIIVAGPRVLRGGVRTGLSARYLHFLKDGDYKATIVERTAEETLRIGRDYILFDSYENWVRFYDDKACTLEIYADRINIYAREEEEGITCVIDVVGPVERFYEKEGRDGGTVEGSGRGQS